MTLVHPQSIEPHVSTRDSSRHDSSHLLPHQGILRRPLGLPCDDEQSPVDGRLDLTFAGVDFDGQVEIYVHVSLAVGVDVAMEGRDSEELVAGWEVFW